MANTKSVLNKNIAYDYDNREKIVPLFEARKPDEKIETHAIMREFIDVDGGAVIVEEYYGHVRVMGFPIYDGGEKSVYDLIESRFAHIPNEDICVSGVTSWDEVNLFMESSYRVSLYNSTESEG